MAAREEKAGQIYFILRLGYNNKEGRLSRCCALVQVGVSKTEEDHTWGSEWGKGGQRPAAAGVRSEKGHIQSERRKQLIYIGGILLVFAIAALCKLHLGFVRSSLM